MQNLLLLVFLLKQACKERYDYYHLVTGQDFFAAPAKKFDEMVGHENMSYIDLFKLPGSPQWWEGGYKIFKYRTLSSYCDIRKPFFKMLNKLFYLLQKISHTTKKLPPLDLYGGNVYCSLHNDFVQWMLSDGTSTKLFNSLRHTACAEEVYFQTVIMNSPFKDKVINRQLRYMDWTSPGPQYLKEKDYEHIIESNSLFCRKVDSQLSKELVSLLEKHIAN